LGRGLVALLTALIGWQLGFGYRRRGLMTKQALRGNVRLVVAFVLGRRGGMALLAGLRRRQFGYVFIRYREMHGSHGVVFEAALTIADLQTHLVVTRASPKEQRASAKNRDSCPLHRTSPSAQTSLKRQLAEFLWWRDIPGIAHSSKAIATM